MTQFSDGEQFYEQTRSRSNTIHLTLQINSESQKRLHLSLLISFLSLSPASTRLSPSVDSAPLPYVIATKHRNHRVHLGEVGPDFATARCNQLVANSSHDFIECENALLGVLHASDAALQSRRQQRRQLIHHRRYRFGKKTLHVGIDGVVDHIHRRAQNLSAACSTCTSLLP